MGDAANERAQATELPEGDVIRVLLDQHARIRDLFDDVLGSAGEHRQHAFDELRALLAVHETAEEMVLRPVTAKTAGQEVVEARNHEEAQANEVLKELEHLDVASEDFEHKLREFRESVEDHAEAEESEEFTIIVAQCEEDQRRTMGKHLQAAESIAPTHPHPSTAGSTSAQYAVGPIASLVDRTRDAISSAMS